MICDVCGRDNPERLTFCQECGKRLRAHHASADAAAPHSSGPSASPSPPPSSVTSTSVDPPRPDEPVVETLSDAPPSMRRVSRPEAPPFTFGFDDVRFTPEAEPVTQAIPSPAAPMPIAAPAPSPPATGPALCTHCGAQNPRTHRFCTTCGGTIGGSAVLAAAYGPPSGAPASMPSSTVAGPPPPPPLDMPAPPVAEAVVAAPVVSIAVSAPASAATVTCLRCQGQCAASARYCKYCGATLALSAAAGAAPEPAAGPRASPQPAAPAQSAPGPTYAGAAAFAPVQAPAHSPSGHQASRPSTPAQLALTPPPAVAVSQAAWSPLGGSDATSFTHAATQPQPPGARAPAAQGVSSSVAQLAAGAAPPTYGAAAAVSSLALHPAPPAAPLGSQASATGTAQHRAPSVSPAPPPGTSSVGAPRLVVLRDDGSEGASFPLTTDVVDLGRREGDILLHDDLYVSPRHARFRREGERVRIIDLASTNGVYLRVRAPVHLATGNLILLGLEVLQFQLVKDAAPPASPHAPSTSAARPRTGGGAGASGSGPSPAGTTDLDAVDMTWAGGRSPAARDVLGAQVAPVSPAASPGAAAPAPPSADGWSLEPQPGYLGQAIQHGTLVFGSPAAPRRASLHQRTVEGIVRDVYHLIRDEVLLGREGADIVFSADPYMSRRHAAIRRDPGTDSWTLSDLGSSNGTFLRIENDAYLTQGDEIRIGRHLFRFEAGAASSGHAVSSGSSGHAGAA